jgi:hypothetical protein
MQALLHGLELVARLLQRRIEIFGAALGVLGI